MARDTAKVQAWLAGTRSLAPGVYYYTGTLVLDRSNVDLNGAGIVLVGKDPTSCALFIQGCSSTTVRNLTLAGVAKSRSQADAAAGIVIRDATNITVTACEVYNRASVGILVTTGATTADIVDGFTISNNIIHDTYADGIHVSWGAKNGTVSGNNIYNTGDDGIGCIGYITDDWPRIENITVSNNTIRITAARGVAIQGCNGATISGNFIYRSAAAGILVASEESYNTGNCDDITVSDNTLEEVRTDTGIGHAAIQIATSNGNIDSTAINNNALKRILANDWFGSVAYYAFTITNTTKSGNTLDGVGVN